MALPFSGGYRQVGDKFFFYEKPKGNFLSRGLETARQKYHIWKMVRAEKKKTANAGKAVPFFENSQGSPENTRPWSSQSVNPAPTGDYGTMQFRRFPVYYGELYSLYSLCPEWRSPVQSLITHSLKPGFKWEKKFAALCGFCDSELEILPESHLCPNCGGPLTEPKEDEYTEADKFLNCCNANNQDISDVLGTLNEDVEIVDEAYLVKMKKYLLDHDGNIVASKLTGIVKADPITMLPIQRPGGLMGGQFWVCPVHRDPFGHDPMSVKSWSTAYDLPPRCDVKGCGAIMKDVYYINSISRMGGSGNASTIYRYYFEGEVVWKKKYRPGLFFGNPPGMVLYHVVSTLVEMNIFSHEYYFMREMPNGIWYVSSSNPEGLVEAINDAKDKKRANRMYEPIIPIHNVGGENAGKLDYVSSMMPLKEAEWTAMRDEYRQRIMAFYEVTPIMQADASTGGGLNNEGLQITVGNRATEKNQRWLQTFVDDITEELGVKNWQCALQQVEEQDRMARLQRVQLNMQNMKLAKELKLEVEITDRDEMGFTTSGQPQTPDPQPIPGFPSQGPSAAPGSLEPEDQGEKASSQRFSGEPASVHRSMTSSAPPGGPTPFPGPDDGIAKAQHDDMVTAYLLADRYDDFVKAFGPAPLFSDIIWSMLQSSPLMWPQFAGVSEVSSARIGDAIFFRMKEGKSLDMDKILKLIRSIDPNISDTQAAAIARSEMMAITNKGRELQWHEDDPDGTRYRYKLVGPLNEATCKAHRMIDAEQGNGLPLEDLKALNARAFETYLAGRGLQQRDAFQLHPNQRHVLVRVRGAA